MGMKPNDVSEQISDLWTVYQTHRAHPLSSSTSFQRRASVPSTYVTSPPGRTNLSCFSVCREKCTNPMRLGWDAEEGVRDEPGSDILY